MAGGGVRITGLTKTIKALQELGLDLDDLKDAMAKVAALAARTASGFVPVRSGVLRGSVRGNRAKNKAVVTVGRARVPYAGAINYGWSSHNISAAGFFAKTDEVMRDQARKIYEDGINVARRKRGL